MVRDEQTVPSSAVRDPHLFYPRDIRDTGVVSVTVNDGSLEVLGHLLLGFGGSQTERAVRDRGHFNTLRVGNFSNFWNFSGGDDISLRCRRSEAGGEEVPIYSSRVGRKDLFTPTFPGSGRDALRPRRNPTHRATSVSGTLSLGPSRRHRPVGSRQCRQGCRGGRRAE